MTVCRQLFLGSQAIENITFEIRAVSLEIFEDLWLKNHEAAVNPAFSGLWFLGELGHEFSVKLNPPKARWRSNRRNGGCGLVGAMIDQELAEIEVRDSVPVGEHETVAPNPRSQPQDSASCVGVCTRIHEVDHPVLIALVANLGLASI